jgi:1-aminocyclopropane-1-carboxylate deaminase/D-cysteine desulfhydrase-like pyridoxal-dependent ACC family enzyme
MLEPLLPLPLGLGILPTPLHPPSNLSNALGVEVWIKRDDMTGFAEGSNKVRKAEFLLADGRQQERDVVLTAGAMQSNHARVIAAASAHCKMECHLVPSGTLPPTPAGNVLLKKESEGFPTRETKSSRIRAQQRPQLRVLTKPPDQPVHVVVEQYHHGKRHKEPHGPATVHEP